MDKDVALSCFGWATIALPYLVLVAANDFASWKGTLVRAVLAVGAGWLLLFAYALIAQALVAANASPEQLLEFYENDGAPMAFAAVFGWVPAILIVGIAWPLHHWLARRRRRRA